MLNPPLSDGEGKPPKVARGWGCRGVLSLRGAGGGALNSKTQHRLKADNSKLNIQNSTFLYPLHVFQNHLLCVNHAVRAMHNAVSNTPLRKPVRGCDDKASM